MKNTIATILLSSIIFVCLSLQRTARAEQQCDPNKPETSPSIRFELNRTNGTVYDTKTMLTWKTCSEGQSYSDGHCIGRAEMLTIVDVNASDKWRLPNEDELNSIVEGKCTNPSINLAIFPDTRTSNYWTDSKKWVSP